MPPKLVKAAPTSAPDSIATVAEKAAGAQGVTPKAAGNMELSPVVTVPSQNTLSTHGMQSAGAPASAAAAAFPPSPSNGSCGGAAAADDSKKTSSLGTPSATSSRISEPPLASSVVSGAISSTGHAPVDSAQLIGAVAELVARSSQLEAGLLSMQQMMGQIMLAHQSHATQVADSLARLSAHHEAAVSASIQSYYEEYGWAAQGSTTAATRLFLMGSVATLPNTGGSGGAVGLVPPPLPPSTGASVGFAPVPDLAVPSGFVTDALRGTAGGIADIQPRAAPFRGGVVSGATSSHLARVAGGLVTPIAQAHHAGIPGTELQSLLHLRTASMALAHGRSLAERVAVHLRALLEGVRPLFCTPE